VTTDSAASLKLEYEYLRDESKRLRDGRAALTRQLGPLPISAAIVAWLVTGFTSDVEGDAFIWVALGLFLALVVISILYSSMKPYRLLRHDVEADFPWSTDSPAAWYEGAIKLEREVYGGPSGGEGGSGWRLWLQARTPRAITDLQDGYDRERSGLFLVQGLFALVVILLIVSRIT
jgi:hypothetical protein